MKFFGMQTVIPHPLWSPEGDDAGGGAPAAATPAPAAAPAPAAGNTGNEAAPAGASVDAAKLYGDLDTDTLAWLGKTGLDKDPKALAAKAYNQEKALGGMIKVPGKDAKPEEIAAYREKLGIPAAADAYEFAVPKDLPENLPYDGERASAFKAKALELGLTKTQAAQMHDWFIAGQVQDFNGMSTAEAERLSTMATAETEKLTKRWGPLTGSQAKAELEFADRALDLGGPEVIEELQRFKLIGPNKEIFSEKLAVLFANIGKTLFKEGDVLRGDPTRMGNVWDEKSPEFNLTKAMQMWKSDPDQAKSMIAAAGKKPSDYGL